MHVCEMADLPGRSVATTSTCASKLERFDKTGKPDIRNFESKFLEMVFQFLTEIIIY